MKLAQAFQFLLVTSPALASPFNAGRFRRDTGTCNIQLATSNGGRKIGIVLDSSGSMSYNDPSNLRIQAGKALNNHLVSSSGAGGGKSADLVTVIDFDSSATVIYPLGDPSGADSSFDQIDSSGGTYIADGIAKGVAELTKPGFDPTADRSGIVVLTDGEDSDVKALIAEIQTAAAAGIRVSFGFLAPSDTFFEPDLLQAILKSGGSYASFETAEAIQSFLFLMLSNGLTAADHSVNTDQPLLSGVTIAKLSGAAPVTFSYAAQAGEALLFTVSSLSSQDLAAELKDASGASVGKNSTGTAQGPASITYTATAAGELKLAVSSSNSTAEGVFEISLNSSLGISGCNLTTLPNNGTGGNGTIGGNATVTGAPTPTKSPYTTVTAAAAKFGTAGFSFVGMALAAAFL